MTGLGPGDGGLQGKGRWALAQELVDENRARAGRRVGCGEPAQTAEPHPLCCPSAMWAGLGMGTCVDLTRTLMATRTRRCPAWITTNTASRCWGQVSGAGALAGQAGPHLTQLPLPPDL